MGEEKNRAGNMIQLRFVPAIEGFFFPYSNSEKIARFAFGAAVVLNF